jgi:hypothetical protein
MHTRGKSSVFLLLGSIFFKREFTIFFLLVTHGKMIEKKKRKKKKDGTLYKNGSNMIFFPS